ncbi:hypothetical protein BGW41_007831 [Actinomortierella wolfii]|nr:hypothetical protein BGW41_007831 [Actinomortierella wolfii]
MQPAHPFPTAIFLDSGGVINDNRRRAPQWLKHLGDFLPTTILGGTAEIWAAANVHVMKTFFKDWQEHMRATMALVEEEDEEEKASEYTLTTATTSTAATTPNNVATFFDRAYRLRWMQEMCLAAAGAIPDIQVTTKDPSRMTKYEARWFPYQVTIQGQALDDATLADLATQAHEYALERVRADFPGAVDTLHTLKKMPTKSTTKTPESSKHQQLRLFTSSGDSSKDLEVVLRGLGEGVVECFETIYGADKVNCLKCSPTYYQRVFAHAQVDPRSVLVLDDNERALGWAKESGAATTVLVAGEEQGEIDLSEEKYRGKVDYRIFSLCELPTLLSSWLI